jgi:putative transposase
MLKIFKLRIYPTKKQISTMNSTLEECRILYNHLLEVRKSSWENEKNNLSFYDQTKYIVKYKKDKENLQQINSQLLENVAMRIDLAFKSFFEELKARKNQVIRDLKELEGMILLLLDKMVLRF